MTHDELLAKVDKMNNYDEFDPSYRERWEKNARKKHDALRAVVELHKPIEEEGKLWCKHEACYSHIEFLERTDCECAYPCPTIQAIEKELS